jgi:hypothetical protein
VLEELRPNDTVTICLPLFLAGGEGDRAFARFYPTIAVDGCEIRCAARATEMYSNKPAASLVVSKIVAESGIEPPQGCRRLNAAGLQAVGLAAESMAELVDELLEKRWSRRSGETISPEEINVAQEPIPVAQEPVQATCSCGSGIPVQKVSIAGQQVTLVALPLIFDQMVQVGKLPSEAVGRELFETVKIYNPIPPGMEEVYTEKILEAYTDFCQNKEPVHE